MLAVFTVGIEPRKLSSAKFKNCCIDANGILESAKIVSAKFLKTLIRENCVPRRFMRYTVVVMVTLFQCI